MEIEQILIKMLTDDIKTFILVNNFNNIYIYIFSTCSPSLMESFRATQGWSLPFHIIILVNVCLYILIEIHITNFIRHFSVHGLNILMLMNKILIRGFIIIQVWQTRTAYFGATLVVLRNFSWLCSQWSLKEMLEPLCSSG